MKWFRSLLLLLVTSVVLISCGDDDKESVPDRLIIDGESFSLTKGYIFGYGPDTDDDGNAGSIYEIILTTDGVDFDGDDFSGTGKFLDLILFSASTIELEERTYTYSLDFLEGTLIDGVSIDGNFDTLEGDLYIILDGEVTVSRLGETWTLKFKFTVENQTTLDEVELTGSYEGLLTEI
jgi:hypothetical protein